MFEFLNLIVTPLKYAEYTEQCSSLICKRSAVSRLSKVKLPNMEYVVILCTKKS